MVPRRPLITLVSVPRGFDSPVARAQRNAINSWRALGNDIEILLCGRDNGVAEIAAAVGAIHAPDIDLSAWGTPMLDSVLSMAAARARARLVCYVNTDIILVSDFVESIRRVPRRKFLMVGQRWDLDVADEFAFDDRGVAALRSRVMRDGTLHSPAGSDYFVYPTDLKWNSPPLVIGRGSWDNWLIYQARALRLPVIDATSAITAIHQNHDYGHIQDRRDAYWSNPEADINVELVGPDRLFDLLDTTHALTATGLRQHLDRPHLRRRFDRLRILHPWVWRATLPLRRLRKLINTSRANPIV